MSTRASYENTPSKRVAFAAYQLFSKFLDGFIKTKSGPRYPHAHDLEEHLEPYIALELIRARKSQLDKPVSLKELNIAEAAALDAVKIVEQNVEHRP